MRLDLTVTRLDLTVTRLDLTVTRPDKTVVRLDLTVTRLDFTVMKNNIIREVVAGVIYCGDQVRGSVCCVNCFCVYHVRVKCLFLLCQLFLSLFHLV